MVVLRRSPVMCCDCIVRYCKVWFAVVQNSTVAVQSSQATFCKCCVLFGSGKAGNVTCGSVAAWSGRVVVQ